MATIILYSITAFALGCKASTVIDDAKAKR